jgi:hypothetical protein
MIHDGKYILSCKAKTIYWFLLFHGIWEPGHQWFGHVDIRMTSNASIVEFTGWSEDSARRSLAELEEKEFIRRTRRFNHQGMQVNDSIELIMPDDWCQYCHKRGSHDCTHGGSTLLPPGLTQPPPG